MIQFMGENTAFVAENAYLSSDVTQRRRQWEA